VPRKGQGWCPPFVRRYARFAKKKNKPSNDERRRMRNAGRRRLLLSARKTACGTRHGKGGLRRPPLAGALTCRRSTAALAKESISSPRRGPGQASWDRALRGLCPPPPAHFQRCTPHAGLSAGRLDARAARERIANPPAGAVLAPMVRHASGPRPSRERGCGCNFIGDKCQGLVARRVTKQR
jgi:hypothetical protein